MIMNVKHDDDFVFNFKVVEHGLGHLPFTEKQVITPTGMSLAPIDYIMPQLCRLYLLLHF